MSSLYSLLIYAAVMVTAGLLLARNKNVHDFLIAGRANPGWVMAAGMTAAWVDATWFVFYAGMGYDYGWGVLVMVTGIVCGFLMLGAYVDKIKTLSTQHDMITFADWFRHKYGRPTGVLLGVIMSNMFLMWLSCVLVGAGLVLSSIFGIRYETVVMVVSFLTVPLILKGGYAGLTRFDVLQFFIITALLVYAFGFGINPGMNLTLPSWKSIGSVDAVSAFSLFLTFFAATFAAGDVWQRAYAAKDAKHVKAGFALSAILTGAALTVAGAIGMMAKSAGYDGKADEAFVWAYRDIFTPGAQSVFFIILLAAVISTLNVTVYGAASSFAKDYVGNAEGVALKNRIQWITVTVIALAMTVALLYQDIMSLGLAMLASTTSIVPLLFFSLSDKIKLRPQSAFWSVLVAFSVFAILVVTGTMSPAFAGLPVAVNLAVIGLVELGFAVKAKLAK